MIDRDKPLGRDKPNPYHGVILSRGKGSAVLSPVPRRRILQCAGQANGVWQKSVQDSSSLTLLLRNKLYAHRHSKIVLLFVLHRMNPVLEAGYARRTVRCIAQNAPTSKERSRHRQRSGRRRRRLECRISFGTANAGHLGEPSGSPQRA